MMPGGGAWTEDRHMAVRPDQTVAVEWVPIEYCTPGPGPVSPEAVEKRWRRMLQQGEASMWPPPIGHWRPDGFLQIDDGRHEYHAALQHGRRELLVAILKPRAPAAPACSCAAKRSTLKFVPA